MFAGGDTGAGIDGVGITGSAKAAPRDIHTMTPTVASTANMRQSDFLTSIHLDPLIDVKEHAAGCREYLSLHHGSVTLLYYNLSKK